MSEQQANSAADVAMPDNLSEIERVAVEMAALAGAEISIALGTIMTIRYKGKAEVGEAPRDPVSEADHRIEQLIRDRIAGHFPGHGVIGEEFEGGAGEGQATVWAIDPIDGTTNFINGFPMFAAAIGVMHHGRPVAGAVWCATGHALRAGVYHASIGRELRFDDSLVEVRDDPQVHRRLAGVPDLARGAGRWEQRKTGSAAVECAFVAAGLLEAARFDTPNIWDVASGIALVKAAGGEVLVQEGDGWQPFTSFGGTGAEMARWNRPMIIGRLSADELIAELG
jgi:myo-inositol-1(or 4)-monophosphatase